MRKDGWISVDERMSRKDEGPVWVCKIGKKHSSHEAYRDKYGTWREPVNENALTFIPTHWRPLPDDPVEEAEFQTASINRVAGSGETRYAVAWGSLVLKRSGYYFTKREADLLARQLNYACETQNIASEGEPLPENEKPQKEHSFHRAKIEFDDRIGSFVVRYGKQTAFGLSFGGGKAYGLHAEEIVDQLNYAYDHIERIRNVADKPVESEDVRDEKTLRWALCTMEEILKRRRSTMSIVNLAGIDQAVDALYRMFTNAFPSKGSQ